MGNLLFIDTSSATLSLAVRTTEGRLNSIHLPEKEQQAKTINTHIQALLEQSNLDIRMLDAVCVCSGPGSYTGLRVGMGVAKGIAFALDKHLLLFDRLQLIADSHPSRQPKLVILSARQKEYFLALFDTDMNPLLPAQHCLEKEMLEKIKNLPTDTLLFTDEENLPLALEHVFISPDFEIDFRKWSVWADKKIQQKDWADLAYAQPSYLKAPFLTKSKKIL